VQDSQEDVTQLLAAISVGDQYAKKRLFSVVYGELHALAHSSRRNESPECFLQTTDLVHETYVRLVRDGDVRWQNRAHFFGIAGRAMRRILVDEYRKKKRVKRGEGRHSLPLDELRDRDHGVAPTAIPFEDLDALDLALDKLGSFAKHRRKCTIVELRFFVGLTLDQTAEALDISRATVKRDWEFTKAWLHQEMQGSEGNAG